MITKVETLEADSAAVFYPLGWVEPAKLSAVERQGRVLGSSLAVDG